jgi:hypothetical protein
MGANQVAKQLADASIHQKMDPFCSFFNSSSRVLLSLISSCWTLWLGGGRCGAIQREEGERKNL